MGFLAGTPEDAKRIKKAVVGIERLLPTIAGQGGRRPVPASAVWVKPTGAPTDDVYSGTFQNWTGSAWTDALEVDDSTPQACKVRAADSGTLTADQVCLGLQVDDDEGVPVVAVFTPASGSAGVSGTIALPSDYTFSGGALQSVGITFTPPSPGFYMIQVDTCVDYTGASGTYVALCKLFTATGYALGEGWQLVGNGSGSATGQSFISPPFFYSTDVDVTASLVLQMAKFTTTMKARAGATGVLTTRLNYAKVG